MTFYFCFKFLVGQIQVLARWRRIQYGQQLPSDIARERTHRLLPIVHWLRNLPILAHHLISVFRSLQVEQVLDGLRLQVGSPIVVITSASKASQRSLTKHYNCVIASEWNRSRAASSPIAASCNLCQPIIQLDKIIISISLLFCFFFLYCHLCQYPRAILNILFGVVDCLHVITFLKINTPLTNVDKPFLRVNFSLAGVEDNTRAFLVVCYICPCSLFIWLLTPYMAKVVVMESTGQFRRTEKLNWVKSRPSPQ